MDLRYKVIVEKTCCFGESANNRKCCEGEEIVLTAKMMLLGKMVSGGGEGGDRVNASICFTFLPE